MSNEVRRRSLNLPTTTTVDTPSARIATIRVPNASLARSPTEEFNLESDDTKTIIRKHVPIRTPRSDFGITPLYRSISSTIFDKEESFYFTTEPTILETTDERQMQLFDVKCKQCLQLCKFAPGVEDENQKKMKAQKLTVLLDILSAVQNAELLIKLGEKQYDELFKIFNINVMRDFPNPPPQWKEPSGKFLDDDHIEEQAWVHLSPIYDIILTLISYKNVKTNYCPSTIQDFLKIIVHMFFSLDRREVEKAMRVFHSFYRVFKNYREQCQKAVSRFFAVFLDSNMPTCGIRHMLSVYFSFASGFKVPLHPDHVNLFKEVLVELHSSQFFFFMASSYKPVLLTFLSKESSLIPFTLRYMVYHWPATSPTKEALFLDELESISAMVQPSDEVSLGYIVRICTICLSSLHYCVVEKALMMWNLEHFKALIAGAAPKTYPALLPVIYRTASTHWLEQIRELAVGAMHIMMAHNTAIFTAVGDHMHELERAEVVGEYNRGAEWIRLVAAYGEGGTTEKERLRDEVCEIYKGFK